MKNLSNKLAFLALALCVALSAPFIVYAQEGEDEPQAEVTTQVEVDEQAEAQPEEQTETEPEEQAAVEAEGQTDVEAEEQAEVESEEQTEVESEEHQSFKGLEGDSWRFQDGQPKIVRGDADALYALAQWEVWCRDDEGYYRSYDGSRIPGAVRRGVDVSEWNDAPNWEEAQADDVSFAILRCGGTFIVSKKTYDDSEFLRNAQECERLGIPWGAYYFSAATTVKQAKEEADFALAQLEGLNPSLPIYLDLEVEEVAAEITPAKFAAISKAFCDKIEAAGYTPGVYASLSWWESYLTDPVFDTWTRWVAQYYSECQYEGSYQLWQCTSEAEIDGIEGWSGVVDLNFEIDENYVVPQPVVEQPPFPDVPLTHWAVNVIRKASDLGFIMGYTDGNFGPDDNITRGQVATILWRMAGQPEPKNGGRSFPDVSANAYFGKAVAWAGAKGVVSGYTSGNFGPYDLVTREQLAAMIAQYAKRVGHQTVVGSYDDFAQMSDADSVSSWARRSVGWCFSNKILSGTTDGRVNPQGNATRAEASKMLVGLHELLS